MGVLSFSKRILEEAIHLVPDDATVHGPSAILRMNLFAVRRLIEKHGLWNATVILKHLSHSDEDRFDIRQIIEGVGPAPAALQEATTFVKAESIVNGIRGFLPKVAEAIPGRTDDLVLGGVGVLMDALAAALKRRTLAEVREVLRHLAESDAPRIDLDKIKARAKAQIDAD